jgi:hypothetical protein
MSFKNWFAKEIYIHLPEESNHFVSTVSYSMRLSKICGFRFKRTVRVRTDEDSVSAHMGPLRSGRKNGMRILEI